MSIISHIGKPGSFSHAAARQKYGSQHTYVGCESFEQVFVSVMEGHSEIGIIPIENSLAGSLNDNYDLFSRYPVSISAEQYLKVEHYLLARKVPGANQQTRLSQIKTVYSHPKALEQCKDFFARHKHMTPTVALDTATAAHLVATSDDPSLAAIGSKESAHLYRLDVLAEHIQDDKANYTRFVSITRRPKPIDGANKVSLEFEVRHEPGSLVRVLEVLNAHSVNLTKIESRPVHGRPFEYMFYLDFEFGPEQSSLIDTIVSEIRASAHRVKVLGIYVAGKLDQ